MKSIVNIMNFIRGCEPRMEVDLLEPVKKQIEFSEKYGFNTTFMVQYDSLIRKDFQDLLLPLDDKYEIGFWLEFNKPLMDAAGLPWKGREGWDWDWHTNVGFTPGYVPEERYKLIDIQFEKFREVFGYYPKSIGSWVLDAKSVAYCGEKYGIDACCYCKDQYGTDGYTLWGGYFNQAYYPSKKNFYHPAQTEENQINVPAFRMLGSDPMYQYDCFLEKRHPDVISLEPVYPNAGSDRAWCQWFFETNFENEALGFAYTQAGQENSFGWDLMKQGFEVQFELMAEYEKKGLISIEKLSDSGKWFKENYKSTPVTTVRAEKDFENRGNKVYWYDSRFYRLNLKIHKGKLIVRDIHKFDENYEEFCYNSNIDSHECKFSALPVYDQLMSYVNRAFSEFEIKAPLLDNYDYILDRENNSQTIKKEGFSLVCYEDRIEISNSEGAEITIKNPMYITDAEDDKLSLFFEGYKYSVALQGAETVCGNKEIKIKSKDKIIIKFS
ncbi:MAG: hypothetical protein KBT47_09240 [Armatimonadetes bacterium]|nr:hypothetical protein [Candidatus Hippobium faecium]